jgi:lactoylglutathione lyase
MIIEHTAVWVRDLESMRAFYTEVLGGESGDLYENPAAGFRSYFLSFGEGARLELMCRAGLAPPPAGPCLGYAHLAFRLGSREAVDGLVAAIGRHGPTAEPRGPGGTVESGPRVTGDGYYEAVILDPEGNRVELMA